MLVPWRRLRSPSFVIGSSRRWPAGGQAKQMAVRSRIGIRVTTFCYSLVLLDVSALMLASVAGNLLPAGRSYWPSWYEWTAFGAIVVGLAIVTTSLNLARKLPAAEEDTTDERPSNVRRFRFRLRDLLLLIVVLAMTSAALASIVRKPLHPGLARHARHSRVPCDYDRAGRVRRAVRRGWIVSGVALVLAIIGSAALHTWVLPDWTSMGAAVWLNEWLSRIKTFLFAFSRHSQRP